MKGIFEQNQSPEYLDLFHQAQASLLNGDFANAKALIEQAIERASLDGQEEEFVWYMKGTQAYIDKDIVGLQQAIDNLGENPNVDILKRFLDRLESGEDLDYGQDYSQGRL